MPESVSEISKIWGAT